MGYSRKKQGEGVEDIFFTLLPEIQDKTKLHSWKFHKVGLDALEIWRPETKTPGPAPGNSPLFFLGHPWNSTLFLISSWKFHKFHMLCLWDPWKVHIFNPPPVSLFFSGIAQLLWLLVVLFIIMIVLLFLSLKFWFLQKIIYSFICFLTFLFTQFWNTYFRPCSHLASRCHSKTIFAVERSDFGIDKPSDALCNLTLLGRLILW